MQSTGKIVSLIIAVLVIIGAVWYFMSRPSAPLYQTPTQQGINQGGTGYMQPPSSSTPSAPANQAPTTAQPVVVQLGAQNNSGEMGTATLTDENGKTKVVISLTGAPKDVLQPAHIHTGTCANIGGVKYALTFPKNGSSETVINVGLSDLLKQGPLALNVHKSAAEITTYVSCGDLPASQPTAAPQPAASPAASAPKASAPSSLGY